MSGKNRDLFTLADEVVDEPSFIDFLCALAADREDEILKESISPSSPYGPGANGWENGTIEDFLGTAAGWAEGSRNGMPLYEVPANPWTRCAQILLMGKVYE
ncbi:MAG: hypothetical protein JWO82_4132 [Akkermansiaceae bacterium]|nr:hypothetical protein [Akkermansiaceae bacterium]